MQKSATDLDSGVVSNPALRGGEPVLAGTSTTVRAVVELWNQGVAIEQITTRLPHLGLDRVLEAIYYYLHHREEIDRYIAANRIPDDWAGRKFDPATGKAP
jgi:uncharacterized protein (DUF433 family)